jgi:hypothetical protein
MKTLVALAAAVMFSFTLSACGKKDGAGGGGDCEKAVDHMISILKKEMPEQAAEMEKDKKEAVEECKKEKPSKAKLDCTMKAKTMDEVLKCEEAK